MAVADTKQAAPSGPREGKLRWVLGWIVLPAALLGALFLTGVHVGARDPDRGLARLVLKLTGAEAGVAAPIDRVGIEPRPGARPGEPFDYSTVLTPTQMQAIADKSLGKTVAELDCSHVCRAWARAEQSVELFSVERCKLGRTVAAAPTQLVCSGKLEAVEPGKPSEADDSAAKRDAP